jgi:DmsE family decaheme c-type cytochrome
VSRLARLVLACSLLASLSTRSSAQEYVGSDRCLACHEKVREGFSHTIHARALGTRGALGELEARGCESCHGPGATHASSAGKDSSGPGWLTFAEEGPEAAARQNEACLQCHAGDTQRFWHGSVHDSRGLSCSSCHSMMKPVSERHLLSRATESAVCSQCHHLARSQVMRSSHIPAREGHASAGGEGFMSCASCHNSHGSIADALIDAHTVNDSCYSCHADKRGPFLWEHAPVSENCLSCHVAHGSLKPGMLRMSGPRLCQTCHIEVLHVSEARRPGSRFVVGKNCMLCHQQVHGSNHPSGSFFTR